MSAYKRIDGDYTIATINLEDNVIIETNTLKVFGNLDVEGNLTYINVSELEVKDPFIVLNTSNTGTYASNSGVLTHKTSSDFAGIRYNTNSGSWEISSSTSATGETGTWTGIATGNLSGAAAGSNTQIQYNNNNNFGADANLSYDFAANKLTLNGYQAFGNIGSAPAIVANSAVLYNSVTGAGGTGMYVKSATVNDELCSRSAAIIFSLIL